MWCCSGPSRVCPLPFCHFQVSSFFHVFCPAFFSVYPFRSQELLLCYSLAGNTKGMKDSNIRETRCALV